MLRRTGRVPSSGEVIEAGGIKLVTKAREVVCEGAALAVTTVEYDILEYLVRAAGRIVSRDELTAALYRRQATPFDRGLDMHISNLRKKLGQPRHLDSYGPRSGLSIPHEPRARRGFLRCARFWRRSCSGRS